mgnify:CR=1 FL=1
MRKFIAKKWKKADKRLKIIALPFLLVGIAAAAGLVLAYGTSNNKDGLVLDIDFSQDNYNSSTRTFTDKSGSGNNAVSTNPAVFTAGKNGQSNKAMSFTSTNDEVAIPHNSGYKSSSITVSFLYKPRNIGKRHVIFTSWTGFTTEIDADGTFKWGLNGLSGQYFGTKKVNWDEWIYLTGTFDNNSKKQCIYFNGIKQECQTVTGSISYGTSALYLSGPWDWIGGDFASAKIYNRALSETEVRDLYNSFKPKTQVSSLEKGLIAYFPMDGENYNSNNNKLTDKSAYSNHANNNGAILTSDRFNKANGAMNFGNSANREYTSSYIKNVSNQLTMSAWIKPSAYPSERGTIILGSGAYYLSLFSDGSIHTYWYGRSPAEYHSSLTGKAPLGEWTQVAAVWRNNSVDLYVNGVLKNTVAINNVSGASSNILILGAEGISRQYKGAMSDVRVYNRDLSDKEIEQLYNNYKPKTSASSLNKGLILDMPLTSKYTKSNTAGSQIMTDNSPYSHDGQNYGGSVGADGTLLSATGQRIETNLQAPNEEGTISIWYKPTYSSIDANRNSILYSTGASFVDNSFELALRGCCGSPYDNVLYMQPTGSSYLRFEWDQPVWNANEWINLVITYSSRNFIRPYVNGVLQTAYQEKNSTGFNFPNKFIIGARNSSTVSAKGTVSDLKIYKRVLSDEEIRSLYERGRGKSGTILNGAQ